MFRKKGPKPRWQPYAQPPIWATYRDVAGYPRKSFERLPEPPSRVMTIKPVIIPGVFGYPDLHIAWHEATKEGVTVHLVTYTEAPLDQAEVDRLINEALSHFGNQTAAGGGEART